MDCVRTIFFTNLKSDRSSSTSDDDSVASERRLEALLETARKERDGALAQLAAIRNREVYLNNALKQALDNIDDQMHFYQSQLQSAQESLHRTCVGAQSDIDHFQETDKKQKAVIEDLQCMIGVLEEENKLQQKEIDVLSEQAEEVERMKRDVEMLQATIQIQKVYDVLGRPNVQVAGNRLCVDTNSSKRRASKRDSGPGGIAPVNLDPPSPPLSATPTYVSSSSTTSSNSDILPNPHDSELGPDSSSATATERTLRRGTDILFTGFSYPKEHAVSDCIPEREGVHHFLGTGSNTHYTRFSCKYCHFWCKEPKVAKGTGVFFGVTCSMYEDADIPLLDFGTCVGS